MNKKYYTKSGECVANGCEGVVFDKRYKHKPYFEFTKSQFNKSSICISKSEHSKLLNNTHTDDDSLIKMKTNIDNVVVCYCKNKLKYGDFKVGYIYISPNDLVDELKKKAPLENKQKKIKISKKDRDASYEKIYEYLTERFKDVEKLKKADFTHYKGKKTILGTPIKERDTLLQVCLIHTNNLDDKDTHIAVHFKYVALRELDAVCKKYYLVKEKREPVLVEIEYMYDGMSKNKIEKEYG